MSDLSVPHELNTDEHKAIIAHLKSLEESDSGEEGMRCFPLNLPGRPPLFIKHCDYDILAEADTQNFFHLLAKDDASAPRIPRVLDAFSSDEGDCFVVMEEIDAQTLGDCGIPEAEAVDLAAFAVKWLQDQLHSVPDTVFGRISSEEEAPVWHQFFKDHQAPGAFANPRVLAEYVSEASQRCRPKERWLSTDQVLASFGDDRRIYHSDIKKENFLLNSKGVWIIDFQHIGVLPQVFQTYAFFNIGEPFAAKVGRKLGYQPSRTANAMVPISGVLQQCGGIPIPKSLTATTTAPTRVTAVHKTRISTVPSTSLEGANPYPLQPTPITSRSWVLDRSTNDPDHKTTAESPASRVVNQLPFSLSRSTDGTKV